MRRFPSRALHEACCGDVHRAQSPVRVEGNLGQSGVRIFAIWQVCHTGDPQPSKVDAGMTALVTAMRRLRASGMAGIAPARAMTPLLPLCS